MSSANSWNKSVPRVEVDQHTPRSSVSSIILAMARTWRKRARQRQELAQIAACDLAEFGIPPGVAAAEASRWFWQQPSRSWQSLERERQYLIDAARWS